ncbi:MAG: ferritin family protein [Candidatus Neomarinimicrobiota bacterium]
MGIFNVKDVFEFAVKIEERGEKFYRETANRLNSPEVVRLFNKLADDEAKHRVTFAKMAEKLGKSVQPENLQDEFYAYLEAYTQNLIFNDSSADFPKINDAKVALTFAIDKELDSVLYYTEIKNLIPISEHSSVDEIINEERRHVVNLSMLRKALSD